MAAAPTWRDLMAEATTALGSPSDARRLVEEASGYEGADLVLRLDERTRQLSETA